MTKPSNTTKGYRFFNDMMSSLRDRRFRFASKTSELSILELCQALIEEDTEAGIFHTSFQIFAAYERLDTTEKTAFLSAINKRFDIDPEEVLVAAQNYKDENTAQNFAGLHTSVTSKRIKLLTRLNQIPGGTEYLVRMRADLLEIMRENKELGRLDHDFRSLLKSWFNRGFLKLQTINWNSPATLLEKIIHYEAVHKIHRWADLRKRLEPQDRRCFSFFHPAMPDEPLIFVEVALTQGIPNSIEAILDDETELDPTLADTATFYSISNCQAGLAGVSFGNSLIKQVVRELSRDFPNLKTYVTLSPIPKLAHWMEQNSFDVSDAGSPEFKSRVADYLMNAKHPSGFPLDPVEKFHLGNGALIHQIHVNADTSEAGMKRSYGAMVNYLYDPKKIVKNQHEFESAKTISASKEVRQLVP